MTREEAEIVLDPFIVSVGQYRVVKRVDAACLLGERYDTLLSDKIRNVGPTPDTLYYWNVLDYLADPAPIPKGELR